MRREEKQSNCRTRHHSPFPTATSVARDSACVLDGRIGGGFHWPVHSSGVSWVPPANFLVHCASFFTTFSKVLCIIQLNISLQRMFLQFNQSSFSFPKSFACVALQGHLLMAVLNLSLCTTAQLPTFPRLSEAK